MARFLFKKDVVEAKEVIVLFGRTASPKTTERDFTIRLLGGDGKVVTEYSIWDPRKAVVERQGIVENAEGDFVARFPFRKDLVAIEVLSRDGTVAARIDVQPAVQHFCKERRTDPDCK